ncbi:MAG: hypothetical protein MUF15_05685 [Acidobacteria bacterium]|jgi:hypothetical protein|nr:hypothetical protein [Acidobacteriota bacterium]
MRIKKIKTFLVLAIVNLIVFFVLLEIIGVTFYFIKNRAFFYTHDKMPLEFAGTEPGVNQAEQLTQLTDKRFQPFFGYTHGVKSAGTNNYGFYCPYDYPLKREKENWYIIGIFGGSVANGFYVDATERLTERLQANSFFADKEIIYLNYALGGYKQPQQLQVLTYFQSIGQELDMVLNIDGFNEVVFCFNNSRLNVDIAMPSAQHFLPMKDLMDKGTVTGEKLDSIWKIQKYKNGFLAISEKLKGTKLASIYLVYSSYGKYLYKKYRAELVRFDGLIKAAKPGNEDSIVNIKFTPGIESEPVLLAQVATLWYRSSFLMNSIISDGLTRGGKYFHFLQPNQYYSGKVFTTAEQRDALDEGLAYGSLVKKGYPVLEKAVVALQQNHVKAFSAVGIFDKVKETIYMDKCCHFNRKGNEILANFTADCILKEIR